MASSWARLVSLATRVELGGGDWLLLLRDHTLPIAALLRHRRAFAVAQRVFGDTRIEELPLDYFCVSCDLLTAGLVVRRRGLVWLASGASMNLPAIYPPLPLEGRLLVGGGVLNTR